MHQFVRNLITEWRRLDLPFSGETFIAAISGGGDSISLLLALDELRKRKKLDVRLVVAHFNHDLRGTESEKDEEFVKHLTRELDFELALGRGKISGEGNLEQNARNARYDFLINTAINTHAYGVLTAHTMNDQAETFLINLIRGSGVSGLSGMRPIRNLEVEKRLERNEENFEASNSIPGSPLLPFTASPLLIRPLLNWAERTDTENFCRECKVEYRYDTMNDDLTFQRVRVRKILLPMLVDFNPRIVETLAKTAELMRHASEPRATAAGSLSEPPAIAGGILDDKTEGTGEDRRGRTGGEVLTLIELKSLTKSELYRTLRQWLESERGHLRSLEFKHIEAIGRLIMSTKSGRTVELPGGEIVFKQDGKLVYANIRVDK